MTTARFVLKIVALSLAAAAAVCAVIAYWDKLGELGEVISPAHNALWGAAQMAFEL